LKRLWSPVLGWGLVLATLGATTNDLRILSIGLDGQGNLTITWTSRPGEFYTVYAADALADWTLWRVIAARIPAAGQTTSWTDDSAQAQRAGATLLPRLLARSDKRLSEEEIAALLEKWKDTPREYPPLPPEERPKWIEELLNSPDRETLLSQWRAKAAESQTMTTSSSPPGSMRFYRVAHLGGAGFVDSWGAIESWNGQWGDEQGQTRDGQYTFHRWFENTAFRGTNYANTPVGALSTVVEPCGPCFIDYRTLFRLWAQGKSFAICAWNGSAGWTVQVTGDPLVRR
jgi:hypothetical protein